MTVLVLAALLAQDPAADLAARARDALAARRHDEAVRLYGQLVQEVPGNPGLITNLGLALHQAGRYQEAAARFRAALKLAPGSFPANLMLGLALQKLGQPAAAIAPLSAAVRLQPGEPTARLELADALLGAGRAAEAIPHFSRLNTPKGLQGVGLSHAAVARQAFAAIEGAAPGSPYWHALAARSLESQGQLRGAFQHYRAALETNPPIPGLRRDLAGVYQAAGHPDWAAAEAKKPEPPCAGLGCDFAAGRFEAILAATRTATAPSALYWRARAASERARASFAALASLPPSAEIHELQAAGLRIEGKHREAVEEWRRALQLSPRDGRLEAELAQSLWQAGEDDEAMKLLERLPDSPAVHFQRGDILAKRGETPQAIAQLEKAVAVPAARALLGRLYLEQGDAQRAVPHLEAGQSVDHATLFHLSRAYQQTGQTAKAKLTLARYQQTMRARTETKDAEITPP
ncbi:MAG: tetratricopeptide repeat protein [Acidobacteria bacterium]|nr:tetratricopeptide repeat protein [Acidobacteriota bacterium]